MPLRHVTRIFALVAAILLCMALALGACMAKRSGVNDPGSVQVENSPTTGSSPMKERTGSSKGPADSDGDVKPEPARPEPAKPGMAEPKGSKGMVGQMHLEGGE